MRKLLPILFSLVIFAAFGQTSKFSLELNYPVTIDDNFIGRNYNGIVDLGFKYCIVESNTVNIGASINAGYLKNSKEDRVQPIDVNLYTIQPRIFGELDLESLSRLHPSAGIGYSFLIFKPQYDDRFGDNQNNDTTLDESGFNINFGLAYDITDNLLIQAQFDFVKIKVEDDVPDITYNSNINIVKIGLGYRF